MATNILQEQIQDRSEDVHSFDTLTLSPGDHVVTRDSIMFQQQCKSGLVASVTVSTLLRLSENVIHVDVPGPLDAVVCRNRHEAGSLSIVG
jgi:hypothetical protein